MKAVFFLFVLMTSALWSQTELRVRTLFRGEILKLNENYVSKLGDTISISTLKFYITNLHLISENKSVTDSTKAYLINIEETESLVLEKNVSQVKKIEFMLGVDSSTNVAGILEGALDPINGMYWAWNSGYINFKVEGTSSAIISNSRKFEFHLGGYLPPYQTVQKFEFEVNPSAKIIYIDLDLEKWLELVKIDENHQLMIPGEAAVNLSNHLQKTIVLSYAF